MLARYSEIDGKKGRVCNTRIIVRVVGLMAHQIEFGTRVIDGFGRNLVNEFGVRVKAHMVELWPALIATLHMVRVETTSGIHKLVVFTSISMV